MIINNLTKLALQWELATAQEVTKGSIMPFQWLTAEVPQGKAPYRLTIKWPEGTYILPKFNSAEVAATFTGKEIVLSGPRGIY